MMIYWHRHTNSSEGHHGIAFRHKFEGEYTTEKKYLLVEAKSRSHFKNKGTSAIPWLLLTLL